MLPVEIVAAMTKVAGSGRGVAVSNRGVAVSGRGYVVSGSGRCDLLPIAVAMCYR